MSACTVSIAQDNFIAICERIAYFKSVVVVLTATYFVKSDVRMLFFVRRYAELPSFERKGHE
jgi:hypothetical protein